MHFSTFMYLNDLLLIIVNELSSSKKLHLDALHISFKLLLSKE